jgi:Zn-dependent protease with chaperone function
MHLLMILLALGVAFSLRLLIVTPRRNLYQRWQQTLFHFFFPPLLLLTTALAVLCMGFEGQMLGMPANWFSYLVALGFIVIASVLGIRKAYQGWKACHALSSYPQQWVAGQQARILPIDLPYSAQVGFWQPELVVSQALLDGLDEAHVQAVLAHEQAHYYYRDTFCFFWLGWLRSFTGWLPHTEELWQDLLWLRELRADQKAAQQVDSLLLAESLLFFAKVSLGSSPDFCAPFSCTVPRNRITERIDALLSDEDRSASSHLCRWSWSGLLLALLPWATVPLHYH